MVPTFATQMTDTASGSAAQLSQRHTPTHTHTHTHTLCKVPSTNTPKATGHATRQNSSSSHKTWRVRTDPGPGAYLSCRNGAVVQSRQRP